MKRWAGWKWIGLLVKGSVGIASFRCTMAGRTASDRDREQIRLILHTMKSRAHDGVECLSGDLPAGDL